MTADHIEGWSGYQFNDADPPCERCGNPVSSLAVGVCRRCSRILEAEDRKRPKVTRTPPRPARATPPKPRKPRKKASLKPRWSNSIKPRTVGVWQCPRCGPLTGQPFHGSDDQFHCNNLDCDEVVGLSPS